MILTQGGFSTQNAARDAAWCAYHGSSSSSHSESDDVPPACSSIVAAFLLIAANFLAAASLRAAAFLDRAGAVAGSGRGAPQISHAGAEEGLWKVQPLHSQVVATSIAVAVTEPHPPPSGLLTASVIPDDASSEVRSSTSEALCGAACAFRRAMPS